MREALVIARRLVEVEPEGAVAQELLARTLLADALLNHVDGAQRNAALATAADVYLVAARLDEGNAPLLHAAGVALDQAGRTELALEHYRRARAIDETDPQFALYAAMALRRLERLDEAQAMVDAAAALAPDEALVEVVRSDLLLARHDANAALLAAQRARTLAPSDLSARIAEARALRSLDRAALAAELLSALPAEARAGEAVAQELADALLAIGRPRDAARVWEAALDRDGRRWRCAIGAAEAWMEAGDLIRADTLLSHALAVAASEPRVIETQTKLDGARRGRAPPLP